MIVFEGKNFLIDFNSDFNKLFFFFKNFIQQNFDRNLGLKNINQKLNFIQISHSAQKRSN